MGLRSWLSLKHSGRICPFLCQILEDGDFVVIDTGTLSEHRPGTKSVLSAHASDTE